MINFFRSLSVIEGISYLIILCVSLGVISREYIFFLGITHGVLFLLYFVFSLIVSHKQSWSVVIWLLVLLAAIIPFAFILVEIFIKKEIKKIE